MHLQIIYEVAMKSRRFTSRSTLHLCQWASVLVPLLTKYNEVEWCKTWSGPFQNSSSFSYRKIEPHYTVAWKDTLTSSQCKALTCFHHWTTGNIFRMCWRKHVNSADYESTLETSRARIWRDENEIFILQIHLATVFRTPYNTYALKSTSERRIL